METSHHFIEVLRQHIHLFAVLIALGEQLDLSQHLVRKGVTHHETWVARGAAEIHQAAFSQQDDFVAAGQGDVIHLRLDVVPLVVLEGRHIDFIIEVADVADNGLIFHLHQVLITNHLVVASGRHKDVHLIHHIV